MVRSMVQHETPLAEQEVQAARAPLAGVHGRRPGRPDHVNPVLIPFLRGEATPGLSSCDETDFECDREVLAPAFGIAVGLVLSAPLWAVIGFAGWAILH